MQSKVSLIAGGLVLLSTLASAQSLADVARKEEARRKDVAQSGKVYTNDSLKTEQAPETTAASPATATKPPSAEPAKPDAAKKADDTAKSTDGKKDEKYWQQRLGAERDALARSQTFADALQSRINGLATDFVNRDDPIQRNQVASDRQKALAELERVKKEIQDHTKAIAAIQEEGRKAGAPAGWLR